MATVSAPTEKNWRVKGVTPGADVAPTKAATPLAQLQSQVKTLSDAVERMSKGDSRDDQRTQAQLNGLSKAVDKLNRLTHADALETQYQTVQALLQGTFALAGEIEALVHQQERKDVAVADGYYQYAKQRRAQEVAVHLSYIERLSKAKQETTPTCTCGQHKGITFTDANGYVLETDMCPRDWWFKRSRLAYRSGVLGTFLSSYPLTDYLYAYRLW